MLKSIYVLIVVAIIAGIVGIWLGPKAVQAPTATIIPENPDTLCTMDAMLCSDGTYVGRSGPRCEFICPVAAASSSIVTSTSSIPDGILPVASSTKSVGASTTGRS